MCVASTVFRNEEVTVRHVSFVFVLLLCGFGLTIGCSGDDGAQGLQGPTGNPGNPQPIDVLIAGAESPATLQQRMILLVSEDLFPIGTKINFVDVTTVAPTLATLSAYDAVLVYSQQTWSEPAALGDVLADYVDAGGGVVLAQGCFVEGPSFQLTGRIMTAGYSPFGAAPTSTGEAGDRTIDVASVAVPFHPVFNGTDVSNLVYAGGAFLSNPVLNTGATLLAANDNGHNALAISANGRLIGSNIWVLGTFSDPAQADARKLLANSLLFVGGGV
jgi:hypothetical protein